MKYIVLESEVRLTEDEKKKWLDIVVKFSSSGVVSKKEIIEIDSNDNFEYKIYLNKEIQENDLEFIVAAWENFYKKDFEIEVDFSENNNKLEKEYKIDEELKDELLEMLSKFLHNRWVDDRVSDGWRYGNRYNLQEKIHPSLRNWDNLPVEYKNKVKITNEKLFSIIESHPTLFG